MSKELFVTSTPHETKLAVVEDDQLVEVFFERENEYTLAGSIYKGKVTRVLPGMQSAFVEIGLERDAFLYVTDFVEPQDEDGEIETIPHGEEQQAGEEPAAAADLPGESRRGGRRGRGDRGRRPQQQRQPANTESAASIESPVEGEESTPFVISNDFDESDLGHPVEQDLTDAVASEDSQDAQQPGNQAQPQSDPQQQDGGARRWRGRRRRGGRRGRGDREDQRPTPAAAASPAPQAEAPRAEAPPQRTG